MGCEPLCILVPTTQKAACKGRGIRVKKEVPVEIVVFSRLFVLGAMQSLGSPGTNGLGHSVDI